MEYIEKVKDVQKKLSYILDKKQKKACIIVLVLIWVGALFETLSVSAIVPLMQVIISADNLTENKFYAHIAEFFGFRQNSHLILFVGIIVIVIYLTKNLFLSFLCYIKVFFSSKIQRDLSVKMMRVYMQKGYSFFLKSNTSKLILGINSDIAGVYNFINQGFKLLSELLTLLCICIFITVMDTSLTFQIIILSGLCLIVIMYLFKEKMKKEGRLYRKYVERTHKHTLQAFEGIKQILVMQKQNYFVKKYDETYCKQQKSMIAITLGEELPAFIIEAVCISSIIVVISIRILNGENMQEFIPKLGAFAIAAFRVLPSLGRISSSFNGLLSANPSLIATYQNLIEANSIENISYVEENENKRLEFNQEIDINKISWKYDTAKEYTFKDLSLKIKKGEAVAIIGASGAGKSTLMNILLGLLSPSSGCVYVDGIDISTIPKRWSQLVGYVPQSIYLTDDTIRNNVAFGLEDNEIDEQLVWNALEQAQIADFVRGLESDIETIVGERGVRFSGGQIQRIALARALYYTPDILILDEATSALDSETENSVMKMINELKGKKTLVIVAHRLSTIQSCDYIYEISDGSLFVRNKTQLFQ